MDLTEKCVKQNLIYSGKVFRVRCDDALLPDGRPCIREVVDHNGGVCVGAITDEGDMLFVRQFRYVYGEVLLEAPAGKLEKGEDHFEAGKRELEEETGFVADNWQYLGVFYPTPGYCGEKIHLYSASGLHKTQMNPDDDEFLEVTKIPLEEVKEMVLRGEIPDGKTQALVLRLALSR